MVNRTEPGEEQEQTLVFIFNSVLLNRNFILPDCGFYRISISAAYLMESNVLDNMSNFDCVLRQQCADQQPFMYKYMLCCFLVGSHFVSNMSTNFLVSFFWCFYWIHKFNISQYLDHSTCQTTQMLCLIITKLLPMCNYELLICIPFIYKHLTFFTSLEAEHCFSR